MPTPGLSLVGFLDRDAALKFLRTACMPAVDTDAALEAEWLNAQANLGAATPNAGQPQIADIPASHQGYIAALAQQQWMRQAIASGRISTPFEFKWVELEPLLAFQFSVDETRSAHHCAHLTNPPTLDELFQLCLPQALPLEQWDWAPAPGSYIVRSRSLNMRMMAHGFFPAPDGTVGGVFFGPAPPLVNVVRFNGRCYLSNGFHRTYGARMAGATHVPCIFRDTVDPLSVGIQPPATFGLPLLESPNPPTLAHFGNGRSRRVNLRAITRVIHISWAEYSLPNE